MLDATFVHLPGVGALGEKKLWSRGILTWDDLYEERRERLPLLGLMGREHVFPDLEESWRALERKNSEYFALALPRPEHFRIALSFPEETLFVDIETTGLSHYYNDITVIGLARQGEYVSFVAGDSLDEAKDLIRNAKCIVTFNGTLFDIPFLKKEMPDIQFPAAHVDLRYLTRRLGWQGGQKSVEEQLGVSRPSELGELRGGDAPALWYEYIAGRSEALDTLVRYNQADLRGMQEILDKAVNALIETQRISWECPPEAKFARAPAQPPTQHKTRVLPTTAAKRLAVSDLLGDSAPRRVVGIDLTGSESRPSGFCALEGRSALTSLLSKDDELLEGVRKFRPHLVSIDSPLSLPVGRQSPWDDDPGRHKFGIMRTCERILKRRGVNVYPSLIPSMQKLTARGIRLAERLRAEGVPVIESYPGAAQDIMGIPRKQAGLCHLRRGLARFGLTGAIATEEVSHDELDAVTCAVVGLFFLSRRFEALGNADEGYLIVPDLKRKAPGSHHVIGISGLIAAGKTTAARYLDSKGYAYVRYSQVIEAEATKRGLPRTREILQQLGKEIHSTKGQKWLLDQLLMRLADLPDRIVVDGMRFPEDHANLVERFGSEFVHVHIEASDSARRRRYLSMGYSNEVFEEISVHSVESQAIKLTKLAHVLIENNSSMDALYAAVDQEQALANSGG